MKKVLVALFALLIIGCKGYSERDRELYFMDAEEVIHAYGMVLVIQPSTQRRTVEEGNKAYGALESFRRKYVGTSVEKDLQFIQAFEKCQEACSEYVGIQQRRILAGEEAEYAEPHAESDVADKKLSDAKGEIISRMVADGYKGFTR